MNLGLLMITVDTPAKRKGIISSIREFLVATNEFIITKVDLIGVELQEEKKNIIELLIVASGTLLFGILSLLLITFSIVLLFWETHRWAALMGVTGLYIAITVVLFLLVRRKARDSKKVFESTVEELKQDIEWVKGHIKGSAH
jgi:uncharacterized membrane protein YqjE